MARSPEEIKAEIEEEDKADISAALDLGADAVFSIRFARDMSEGHKIAIAEWLREKAADLLAEGHNYAACFTARYNPDPGTEK